MVWVCQGVSTNASISAKGRGPQGGQLCTVSAPVPRHQGTPAADTIALGFPRLAQATVTQPVRKLLLTLRTAPGVGRLGL